MTSPLGIAVATAILGFFYIVFCCICDVDSFVGRDVV